MFIPVLINLIHYNKFGHMYMYHKFSYHCFHEHWPIIADEHYILRAENSSNNGSRPIFEDRWQYHVLTAEERTEIETYVIPAELHNQLQKKKGSYLAESLFLQNERCPELEELLEGFISEIRKHSQEPIEGFLMLEKKVKSVEVVAAKYGIPVLCIGMGPLRDPDYRSTSYLCWNDLYAGSEECERRYQHFLEEFPSEGKFFSSKELLALFLASTNIKYLPLYDLEPENEMLVAGTYAVMPTLFSFTMCGDCEVLWDVQEIYGGNYRFRPNPSDPFQAMYHQARLDRSQPGILSVVNTKRIASMGSNILFDAMLWGRTACCKTGMFPVSFQCQQNYLPEEYVPVPESFLNFFCFCFLIPFEFMLDADYLKWRMTGPTEMEIYQRHLDHYLKEKKIEKFIIELPEDERLKALLYAQGYDAHLAETLPQSSLRQQFRQYTQKSTARPAMATSEAQKYLDTVLNSTCWRMTAPLRKVMDWIKGIRKKG